VAGPLNCKLPPVHKPAVLASDFPDRVQGTQAQRYVHGLLTRGSPGKAGAVVVTKIKGNGTIGKTDEPVPAAGFQEQDGSPPAGMHPYSHATLPLPGPGGGYHSYFLSLLRATYPYAFIVPHGLSGKICPLPGRPCV